jgi:hypothetical protein
MNRHVLGYFLILFGIYKIITSILSEFVSEELKEEEKGNTIIAKHVFNICLLIYGFDSLLHGLYLKRWVIHNPPWIITHEGSYVFHMILGLFMFVLFYSLLSVNASFYVIEGIYWGLILLIITPMMYWYHSIHSHKIMSMLEIISCTVTITFLLYIGYTIMIANPERVPNLVDMSMITLNALV